MGVSESSVKRWVDQGAIPSHRTAGGHRRMPASGVVRFLREQGYQPTRPELLGLPRTLALTIGSIRPGAVVELTQALEAGDDSTVRAAVLGPFLAGTTLAELFDQLVAPAFHKIGHDWATASLEVYREHRSVEIATRLLHELHALLPEPAGRAPRAVGATLENDPYTLPLLMGELVLRENGWAAESLGPGLPVQTLCAALLELSPRLLWINVSHVADRLQLIRSFADLHDEARKRGVAVVLGGQAVDAELRSRMRCTAFLGSMVELVGLAETLARSR